jgi:hypothetical protein
MEADVDGYPREGASARRLGVRDTDITADDEFEVEPLSGGISVSPNAPENLPRHRRPPEYGGTGKDPVWMIDSDELPEGLTYTPDDRDPDTHGFIEPTERMRFDVYEDLISETRNSWRLA